jgi:hypothetical protein
MIFLINFRELPKLFVVVVGNGEVLFFGGQGGLFTIIFVCRLILSLLSGFSGRTTNKTFFQREVVSEDHL